ncbi:MAG: hypothetical protein HKP14_08115 [Bacteroidia bacterium]|nr:hypothetical protein [Bacteroidia bacterium]
MKYKRLPKEELNNLEKEFIEFLVINGISAEDWIKIKDEEHETAEDLIDQFSDVVWEGVLRKTNYLVKLENQIAYYFKCDPDDIHLIRVTEVNGKAIQEVASKKYIKVRETEIFEMIENGCEISDSNSYEMLSQ